MQKYIISSRNEKKKERKPVFETFFFAQRATFHLFFLSLEKNKVSLT